MAVVKVGEVVTEVVTVAVVTLVTAAAEQLVRPAVGGDREARWFQWRRRR